MKQLEWFVLLGKTIFCIPRYLPIKPSISAAKST